MAKHILLSTLFFLVFSASGMASTVFNVKDFGAKGDGVSIDSHSINKAIEAAAENGGGTVYLPAGQYLCLSIRLQSNIRIYLDHGAIVKAAAPTAEHHYDLPEENASTYQDFGHSHWKNSLIWGIGLHDVAIEGFGLIDGTDGLTRGQRLANGHPAANKAIALKECRNVTIRDISMLRCGHFALLLTGVENLTIDNVRCDTNRDGFDIDCCTNVRVSNCHVNTLNDDAIVLKSSYALGYAKATENVTITNCHVSGYDIGTMIDGTYGTTTSAAPDRDGPTGRIKFGTESNGGFRNITISNCTFDRCRGLALETVDGGVIEDIVINNIAMRNICNSPLYIRLGNRARGPEGTPVGAIRRVTLSNISVKNADSRYASMIFGIEGHPIEGITLSNIHIQYRGGITMDDVAEQRGANTFFTKGNTKLNETGGSNRSGTAVAENDDKSGKSPSPYDVPQMEKGYPEPSSHGILPVYGLFISHAKDVFADNIKLENIQSDGRPAVLIIDAEDLRLHDIRADKPISSPHLVLREAKNIKLKEFCGLKDRTIDDVRNEKALDR